MKISSIKLKSKENLQNILKIQNNNKIFLVAYHPTTLGDLTPIEELKILLSARKYIKNKILFLQAQI